MSATEEQLIVLTIPFTASSGKKYDLSKPSLAIRLKYVDFLKKTTGSDELIGLLASNDLDSVTYENALKSIETLMNELVLLLEFWLGKTYPNITQQEILDNFDLPDIGKLRNTIGGIEEDIAAAFPPVPNRAARRAARKK